MSLDVTPHAALPADRARVAWVIPTHRPHFAYAAELLRGVSEHALDVDVHFVLGERAEADELGELLDATPPASLIVAEEHLPAGRLKAYLAIGSIINVKKFVGLSALADRYELLCTLDSETAVLRGGDVRRSHALRHGRRAFPAHTVQAPFMRRIVQSSARLLGVAAEERILREVTDGGRLYAWFEDVPVYERDALGEMLERLGAQHDLTMLCDRLSWFDFDHILYQYFCCLYRGWGLEDLGWSAPQSDGAWWENWRADVPEHRIMAAAFAQRWAPSWVRDPALLDTVPSAFMTFHRDRPALIDGAEPEPALAAIAS